MTTDAADRNEALRGTTKAKISKPQPVEKEKLQITLSGEIANTQASHPPPSVYLPFKTAVLSRRTQWDNLFKGFIRMKAISFVVQPVFLLDYFETRGYESIELLVGKGLTEQYKEKMADTKWQTIERLHERVDSQELILWGTKDLVHTKLYILEGAAFTRVITGSPNLSYKASGSGQTEFVVYYDLYPGVPAHEAALEQFEKRYASHFNDKCSKFMEDLSELFVDLDDLSPKEVIRLWKSNSQSSDLRGYRVIYDELSAEAMRETTDEEDDVITITIPKISPSHKKVLTETLGAKFDGTDITVSRKKFLNASSHRGIPQMKLNETTGQLKVGVSGKSKSVNDSYTKEELSQSLQDISRYISMVDSATCAAPDYVKMSMLESILFAFSAPFANHWLRNKRQLTNYSNRRGPRHLLLIGDGFNGKTTFLRYINWLISGSHVEPVDAKKYTTKEWTDLFAHMQTSGTMMPVMIDDIKKRAVQGKTPALEPFIKSYFEGEWNDKLTYPLLLGSSNYSIEGDWAKSRVRRLNFDVQFSGDESDEILISKLISTKNVAFSAFSSKYINRLAKGIEYNKDELFDARTVLRSLYEEAGLDVPKYFPHTPPEDHFDVDAIYCYAQVRKHKLVKEKRSRGVVILTFKGYKALHEFRGRLPQTIKSQFNNQELIIENPDIYEEFLAKGNASGKKSVLSRFFRK